MFIRESAGCLKVKISTSLVPAGKYISKIVPPGSTALSHLLQFLKVILQLKEQRLNLLNGTSNPST